MSCNCQNNNPCGQPIPCATPNCACPVIISSDCVNNVTEDLPCSNIIKGQTLTEVLKQLDAFICTKFESLVNYLAIINVGEGAELFKGTNLVGKEQFRSLVDSNLINISQGVDEITISVDETALDAFIEANQLTYTTVNAGAGAGLFKDNTVVGGNTQFNLKSLVDSNLINITVGTSDITISVDETALNTFIESNQKTYTNSNLGLGAKVYKDDTVVGDNRQFNLRSLVSSDGSVLITEGADNIDLKIKTIVSPSGSIIVTSDTDEIFIETANLQRTQAIIAGGDYTLQNTDNNYSIIIDNAGTATITVPSALSSKFQVGFIQKGTGDITFVGSGGATLLNPIGLKSKGQYYHTFIEKEGATTTYYLLGDTKI